jgi:predicted nuclease with TOPRIM domain
MSKSKSAKEKDFDLWATEWNNAYNFFNTKGNIHTKSKLKDKWYKEFGIMINQRINLAIDIATHDCEEKIRKKNEVIESWKKLDNMKNIEGRRMLSKISNLEDINKKLQKENTDLRELNKILICENQFFADKVSELKETLEVLSNKKVNKRQK